VVFIPLVFSADTTDEAADVFFPGYAHTFYRKSARNAAGNRHTRQFDALRGPTGALLSATLKRSQKAPLRE